MMKLGTGSFFPYAWDILADLRMKKDIYNHSNSNWMIPYLRVQFAFWSMDMYE